MAPEGKFMVDKVIFYLINNRLRKTIQGGFYEEGSVSGLSPQPYPGWRNT